MGVDGSPGKVGPFGVGTGKCRHWRTEAVSKHTGIEPEARPRARSRKGPAPPRTKPPPQKKEGGGRASRAFSAWRPGKGPRFGAVATSERGWGRDAVSLRVAPRKGSTPPRGGATLRPLPCCRESFRGKDSTLNWLRTQKRKEYTSHNSLIATLFVQKKTGRGEGLLFSDSLSAHSVQKKKRGEKGGHQRFYHIVCLLSSFLVTPGFWVTFESLTKKRT